MSGGVEKVPPKKGGIDYSKFDSIVDSDDEKPATKNSTDASKKVETPEKPHCHNCMKDIVKPLLCGKCKKVSYCSQECQKSDWSFHKRNCKKPEEPKPKASPQEKQAKKEAKEETKKQKAEEKVIEESEESLTWYRHREWKPEKKEEFKPRQIEDPADRSIVENPKAGGDGAVWNAAGTWEDKDVTEMAKRTLQDKLQSPFASIDVAGGAISVEEVEKVDGEASKPVIQKRRRHLFDLTFKVKFSFKWMDSGGQQQAGGTVEVSDFTNDAFNADGDNAPVFSVSFQARSLDTARKQAVEDALGAKCWRPPVGSLCAALVDRMEEWAKEYQAKE
jgi:hypothetical protein